MTRLKAQLGQEEEDKIRWFERLKDCHKRCQELEKRTLTPENRDRILTALGVGKQSPQYKRVKAELDKLIGDVQCE